jgi:hypothetical protein
LLCSHQYSLQIKKLLAGEELRFLLAVVQPMPLSIPFDAQSRRTSYRPSKAS